ncbi:toll/interleukin-1 receptor domain-containing protein [Caulobacter sp. UNC279MFTsu5.1]|uniref:toll/interleukin-1 receptor domain-containing protein n=1 Tax=Caulobacter sp. UNC279MFTsu5.1 TaxID=1502775 RepID=UPI0008F303E8|nr:toll/interleukin-1 receptor domain-containing protein [Caulobacter sp. UNC279MFTsu5.1]SFJ95598.1 MTH538 TIR-like domain [Caulobacter sp. UNC279MFTsu5.1]
MDSRPRYRAFISYSHQDRKAAEWLHRVLETYRAPRRLATTSGEMSTRRLTPIFRDRDELSASPDLGGVIRDALDRSDALIVLCSPASAVSRWVDQEAAYFLEDHGLGQVICVIAPTTPKGAPLAEVLPPALRAALPTGVEPLAVDPRRDADGLRLARLKIAARLLDVRLDQLVQRDARRGMRLMAAFTAVAVVVTLAMGAMTVATLKSRQIARNQRDETEALVAYMLGDLREQLEPVGRLDVLDGVSAKVLAYYGKARTDQLDDRALAQRAKAQTLLGTIREQRGDLSGARDAFGQAASTTHELAARAPDNGERIFDEAQNVYWLAYMQWRQGDTAGAEQGFKRYGELAQTLVRLDPSRADWRLEVAYAKSNLGTLLLEQGRAEEALTTFRAALAGFEAERIRAPDDQDRLVDAVDAHAWVADSLAKLGRPREAYAEREGAASLLAAASAKAPTDKPLAARNLAAQLALARLELDLGQVTQGAARSAHALNGLRELAALDPTNARWREYLLIGQLDAADFAAWSAGLTQARAAHAQAATTLAGLRTGDEARTWRIDLDGRLDVQAITLARLGGDPAGARSLALALLDRLDRTSGSRETAAERAALYGAAHLAAGQPAAAISALSPRRRSLSSTSLDILARAYLAQGQRDQAQTIVKDLRKQGYAYPGFLAFWRESPLAGATVQGGFT